MNLRVFAFTACLASAASPCLALTVQTAPPSPDLAHRLAPSGNGFGMKGDGAWARDGRPGDGSSFYRDGSAYRSSQTFGSTTVTTTFRSGDPRDAWAEDPRWNDPYGNDRRRETPAPLSLSPPRR